MEAKLKEKKAVEATVEVTVPAGEVDAAFERVLGQLARQVRVPGFRPGKAPRGVLIKRIGEEALQGEVREHLVERSYPDAVKQFELEPLNAHIHGGEPVRGQDFTFDLHMDLYPEFELPPLEEIVIDTEARRVDDQMVEETVQRLQSENATLIPVDRAVEPGDYLLIETVSEGEVDEGDEASTMPIDLESVSDELAEQLIGRSVGELVELRLGTQAENQDSEAPAANENETAETEGSGDEGDGASAEEAGDGDVGDEEGASETASGSEPTLLRVRIRDVKDKEKPQADDEFAKTLGFESWEQAEEQIRASLQAQLDEQAFEEQRDEFVEKLMASSEFELPNSLVRRRQSDLLENLVEDLRGRGMNLEQYLAQLDEQDRRSEFERELQEAAEKGVRRDLVLERLLEMRPTKVGDAEFEAALRQLAGQLRTDPDKLRKERGDRWLANYRFLLTRDRALNETLRELLGKQIAEDGEAAQGDGSAGGGEASAVQVSNAEDGEPAGGNASDTASAQTAADGTSAGDQSAPRSSDERG